MRRLYRNLGKNPLLVCMFIILLSAPFVIEVFEPRFNSNYDFYFEDNDPVLLEYQRFAKEFNVKEQVIVILEIKDVFTNQGLEAIYRTTSAIRNLSKVAQVTSLATFKSLGDLKGALDLQLLIPEPKKVAGDGTPQFDLSPEELVQVKDRILKDPWVKNKIVFKDGLYNALIVDLDTMKTVAEKASVVKEIHEKIKNNLPQGVGKYYVLGTPPAEVALEETLKKDNTNFQLYMPVIVSFLVLLLVRNLFASLILVANVFLTAGWLIGLMYQTGEALNPVTSLIMPTLIATGIAEGIHIVTHFLDLVREEGKSYKEAILSSMNEMWLPTLMTGMTSIVGYMSFLSSDIFPVKMMGVYMTLGLLLALGMTLIFIPALFLGLAPLVQKLERKKPAQGQHKPKAQDKASILEENPVEINQMSAFEKLSRLILSYPKSLLCVVVTASACLIFGMTRMKIDTNLETFLPEHGDIRQNIEFVEKNVGNQTRYEVVLYMNDDHNDFSNPVALGQIETFRKIVSDHFAAKGEIDSSWSVYDIIKIVNTSVNGQKDLPEERSGVLELFELADQEMLSQMLTPQMRAARVSFLGNFKESSQKIEFIETVQEASKLVFAGKVKAVTVSIPILYFWVGERVFQTQVSSFATAFIPIFLMMSIIGRSLRMGVVSMLPNILPIFVLFGVMGWMGIALDTATAMIASIVLGIAVDDTVHFLHRYNTYTKAGYGRIDGIAKTFAHCGKASLFTSTIVALGFLGLVTSELNPLRMFGALTALAMMIGVLSEIFVLPLALYFLDYKTPYHTSRVTLHVRTLKAKERAEDLKKSS